MCLTFLSSRLPSVFHTFESLAHVGGAACCGKDQGMSSVAPHLPQLTPLSPINCARLLPCECVRSVKNGLRLKKVYVPVLRTS
jgi:hypothetical protein